MSWKEFLGLLVVHSSWWAFLVLPSCVLASNHFFTCRTVFFSCLKKSRFPEFLRFFPSQSKTADKKQAGSEESAVHQSSPILASCFCLSFSSSHFTSQLLLGLNEFFRDPYIILPGRTHPKPERLPQDSGFELVIVTSADTNKALK